MPCLLKIPPGHQQMRRLHVEHVSSTEIDDHIKVQVLQSMGRPMVGSASSSCMRQVSMLLLHIGNSPLYTDAEQL